MRRLFAIAALAAVPAAHAQSDMVGSTLHYERTNIDGSDPEQIYFHRAAPDTIRVYKMVQRCTHSVVVTATLDPETGQVSKFVGSTLLPDAATTDYVWLRDDPSRDQLIGRIDMPGLQRDLSVALRMRPWHDYDYDLASLGVAFEARKGSRADMFFGMTMFWRDDADPDTLLHWIGVATARFARAERHLGRNTLRFEVSGSAFGAAGGGPLWIDARRGFIVDAQWGRPNHRGYKDFRLRLVGAEASGETAWTALLERHYEGCPPGSGDSSAP